MKNRIKKQIWLSEEDDAELKRKAALTGLTETAVFRLLLRSYEPKEKPDERFYEAMRELSAIGNNINQLAAKANTLGFIDAPMLRREAERWHRFQADIEAVYLRPGASKLKWNRESEDNTMRKSDFALPTLDDLFSTQAERDDAKLERVRNIPLAELHPFKGHPFKVQNNEEMQRMIESIRKVSAITPVLARPLPDGGYELISGHRQLAACQALGFETMPVIVRELSDDEAVIAMANAFSLGRIVSRCKLASTIAITASSSDSSRTMTGIVSTPNT